MTTYYDYYDAERSFDPQEAARAGRREREAWEPTFEGWMGSLHGAGHWDEIAAEIGQENQARVALVGLANAGKSVLFNRLRGWVISRPSLKLGVQEGIAIEALGLFVLADLPETRGGSPDSAAELLLALGEPALSVYVLDATAGVRAADFRWVALLRASGCPLLVVLNKYDLEKRRAVSAAEAEARLGLPVIPISALRGTNVENWLLPAALDAVPKLAVPLAREIVRLRRAASRRVIRQAALFALAVGLQPVPGLDLPFQAMLQLGTVMRVGAAFGHPPSGGVGREVASATLGALGMRYLVQAVVKFVPILGWAASGAISGASTLLLGEAAIRYYESNRAAHLRHYLSREGERLGTWLAWARGHLSHPVLR